MAVVPRGNNVALSIIAAVLPILLALGGAILIYILIMPKKKDGKFGNAFLQWIHDFFHFKKLYIESILRFCFCFLTLYCIFDGIVFLCTGGDALLGLLGIFAGPIAIRLGYEVVLMVLLGIRNIMEINNKLPNFKNQVTKKNEEEPAADVAAAVATTVENVIESVNAPQEVTPAAPSFCPHCGAPNTDGGKYCISCGNLIQ